MRILQRIRWKIKWLLPYSVRSWRGPLYRYKFRAQVRRAKLIVPAEKFSMFHDWALRSRYYEGFNK
jgi:hypothetical protein